MRLLHSLFYIKEREEGVDKVARRKLILASVLCILFMIGNSLVLFSVAKEPRFPPKKLCILTSFPPPPHILFLSKFLRKLINCWLTWQKASERSWQHWFSFVFLSTILFLARTYEFCEFVLLPIFHYQYWMQSSDVTPKQDQKLENFCQIRVYYSFIKNQINIPSFEKLCYWTPYWTSA
jgi:hypothetical protein